MRKRNHIKPGLYTMMYEQLKGIAEVRGWNLVVHGTMNRDLDLIVFPWKNDIVSEQDLIREFQLYLVGKVEVDKDGKVPFTKLPGGRHSYVINLNRGNKRGEWVRYEDEEYYLDISVVQVKGVKQRK